MKKFLLLSFAMVAAAISQAVTISWEVPTSGDATDAYAWTGNIAEIRIVYSTAELTTAAEVYNATTSSTASTTTIVYNDVEGAVLPLGTDADKTNRKVLTVWRNSVAPDYDLANGFVFDNSDGDGVYYYLVVTEKDANNDLTGNYAVAGTGEITGVGQKGVLSNLAGTEPNATDYFDLDGWMQGSTWKAAVVPEPTILALLALGVAGVALRRKQNFTK